ncbi:hypothetical protein [Streptomyces sp. DASNCL29]|uniref:hypothetical protein n=1 Tax=Streptomyces sp. DASNCL29 TaxID=2583819 RepID=UPI0019D0258E|nr:hypothetical protein [Streptomyces sp. DASNCL29]
MRGEAEATPAADEQHAVEGPFEPVDLLSDRSLCHMQGISRSGHAGPLCRDDEGPEQCGVEIARHSGFITLIATVTPGGATTLATASGAHLGFRRSVPLMAGVAVGLASMAAAAGAGLGGALLAVPWLQVWRTPSTPAAPETVPVAWRRRRLPAR